MAQIYTTNSNNLGKVSNFFEMRGYKLKCKVLNETPASGEGKLVEVAVEGFNSSNLKDNDLNEWQEISNYLSVSTAKPKTNSLYNLEKAFLNADEKIFRFLKKIGAITLKDKEIDMAYAIKRTRLEAKYSGRI